MREDPIILEDWKPGHPSKKFFFPVSQIDFLASISVILLNLVQSIYYKDFVIAYLNIVIIIGVLVLQYMRPQSRRGTTFRITEIVILFYWIKVSPVSFKEPWVVWVYSVAFFIKLATTSIMLQMINLVDEIFIPKSKAVEEKLDNALRNLEVTDYRIDVKEIETSKRALITNFTLKFSLIFIILSVSNLVITKLSIYYFKFIQVTFIFLVLSFAIVLTVYIWQWIKQKRKGGSPS